LSSWRILWRISSPIVTAMSENTTWHMRRKHQEQEMWWLSVPCDRGPCLRWGSFKISQTAGERSRHKQDFAAWICSDLGGAAEAKVLSLQGAHTWLLEDPWWFYSQAMKVK
jgi:hypothetical protein